MSIIRSSPESARGRARLGFTMIELMVAITISGLLVTVIFQTLLGNSRFVRTQTAREEVQQNARAAVELMASDLRSIVPGAIIEAQRTSLYFYLPRAWGVLCNQVTSSTTTAWVVFPAGVFPMAEFEAGKKHWGIAVEQSSHPGERTGVWLPRSSVGLLTSGDPCATNLGFTPGTAHERFGFTHSSGFANSGVTVQPGTPVMVFREMNYDVGPSGDGAVPGSWVRRMVGHNTSGNKHMQALAGPVPTDSALRFTYLNASGAPTTNLSQIRRIGMTLITQSSMRRHTSGTNIPHQMDTVSTEIFLRNSQ